MNEQRDAANTVSLTTELARVRAWADFASDLLDAHIWGFGPGDWQAGDALAHALEGNDWPPSWSRDPDDATHIVVDPALWPTPGRVVTSSGVEPEVDYDRLADEAERGFDLSEWRPRKPW